MGDGHGPDIVDPWAVLSVAADRTSSLVLGPMITPVPRRRPWVLARQTVTLDRLADGRTVVGVGIGSPAYGDFGIFGERVKFTDGSVVDLQSLYMQGSIPS